MRVFKKLILGVYSNRVELHLTTTQGAEYQQRSNPGATGEESQEEKKNLLTSAKSNF